MSRLICRAIRKDGQPCRGPALPGSAWCWCHDPDRQEQLAAARSRGARTANRLRVLHGRRLRLDTMRALVRFLSDLMQDTLAQRVDPRVSNAVVYAVSVQLQAIEKGDLERRVADLETRSRWRKA